MTNFSKIRRVLAVTILADKVTHKACLTNDIDNIDNSFNEFAICVYCLYAKY